MPFPQTITGRLIAVITMGAFLLLLENRAGAATYPQQRGDAAPATSRTSTEVAVRLRARNEQIKVLVRGRPLVLHAYLPEAVSPDTPLVLFSSGSGGWHQFDDHIAQVFAERGFPVCGISTHSYLKAFYSGKRPATPDEVGADYAALIKQGRLTAGVDESRSVILAGWSLGAGYAVLVAADPRIKPMVRGVVSVSISRDNETVLTLRHRLMSRLTGKTFGPSFDVTAFLKSVSPVPIALIQSKGDDSASPKHAQALIEEAQQTQSESSRLFTANSARNHSFAGSESDFDQRLEEALDWITTRGRAGSSAGPSASDRLNRTLEPSFSPILQKLE